MLKHTRLIFRIRSTGELAVDTHTVRSKGSSLIRVLRLLGRDGLVSGEIREVPFSDLEVMGEGEM